MNLIVFRRSVFAQLFEFQSRYSFLGPRGTIECTRGSICHPAMIQNTQTFHLNCNEYLISDSECKRDGDHMERLKHHCDCGLFLMFPRTQLPSLWSTTHAPHASGLASAMRFVYSWPHTQANRNRERATIA